jgi:ABC-type antimicrobial peptide transport system permease subunit
VIWSKLILGGFGRRGFEALVAAGILAVAAAMVAASLMVVAGARDALARAERADRPDVVQVKSRFNRALFETPRSGHLPPATLPVYEPLIEPQDLRTAADDATVIPRQSLFRNVVWEDGFLNVYIFGIDPDAERQVSSFSLARGRFLRLTDRTEAVVDRASAQALGIDIGGTFPVRKADGEDVVLTVVGILDRVELRDPPPRTVAAPALAPESNAVSGGVFVTLRMSEEIFGRPTLTDALVVARRAETVPSLVDRLREAFRLEPGVFVRERYLQFARKVHDFALALGFFAAVGTAAALLAGAFAASLLHDVYAERRRQYATLMALGAPPLRAAMLSLALAASVALAGGLAAAGLALAFAPRQFAMPSLMADLGTIEPRFNGLVGAAVAAVVIGAVAGGMAPTAWRLCRSPLAETLSDMGR